MAKKEQKIEYYILSCVGISDKKPREEMLKYSDITDKINDKIIKEKLKNWSEIYNGFIYRDRGKNSHIYKGYEPAIGPVCGLILEEYKTTFEIKNKIQLLKGIEKYYILVNSKGENDSESYEYIEKVLKEVDRNTREEYKLKDKICKIEYRSNSEDPNDIQEFFNAVYNSLKKEFDDELKSKNEKALLIYTNPGSTGMAYGLMNLYTKGLFQNYFSKTLLVTRKDFSHERTEENIVRITDVYNLTRLDNKIEKSTGMVEPEDLQTECYRNIVNDIKKAARLNIPVLLYGERGTGKSTFANYYHRCRQEKGQVETDKEMVTCVLSEYGDKDNMRDEFFGWEKDAFTGANSSYEGLLGRSNCSTLFLDEVHHLAKDLQAALLRPLNDGSYRPRRGEDKKIQFGLVVATNDEEKYKELNDDFRDRIERIKIGLPAIKDIDIEDRILFFESIFSQSLERSGIAGFDSFESIQEESKKILTGFLKDYKFPSNLRDMKKLSDYIILKCSNNDESKIVFTPEKIDNIINEIFNNKTE
ncbi:MAG TPA: sigma 54-interacting transcriptional regulator [Spirochaetota bacterium]|jgi:energy-coupling factor transporter ATP-binding protein EcfA2|nr:MAG: Nitric oxide reductase transcription regulator NorR2 [Spirochaetes bacterium ADurb.Bin133]HNZ26695.1 sigma 54-interacting transcriptional regulator [Spirochaetota bacterium]HPY88050.1 sigma 54-interacting transcriptional regulator [Spirochaetota bacterium]HQB60187.1 sigma 54-interacting transcriptional regulator [Spirochaetota bacterium]